MANYIDRTYVSYFCDDNKLASMLLENGTSAALTGSKLDVYISGACERIDMVLNQAGYSTPLPVSGSDFSSIPAPVKRVCAFMVLADLYAQSGMTDIPKTLQSDIDNGLGFIRNMMDKRTQVPTLQASSESGAGGLVVSSTDNGDVAARYFSKQGFGTSF